MLVTIPTFWLTINPFTDTAWERVPLTIEAKKAVWRANNGAYTLREPSLAAFRKQFLEPGTSVDEVMTANRSLFFGLDLFFVKVT
jgi:hypothetical protein